MLGLRLFASRRDWSSLGMALSVAALATSGTLAFVCPGKLSGGLLARASRPRPGHVRPVFQTECRMTGAGALQHFAVTAGAVANRVTPAGCCFPRLRSRATWMPRRVLFLVP